MNGRVVVAWHLYAGRPADPVGQRPATNRSVKSPVPDSLSQLYQRLRLNLRYKPHENAVEVTSNVRVVSAGSEEQCLESVDLPVRGVPSR